MGIHRGVIETVLAAVTWQAAMSQQVVFPLNVGGRWEYDEPNGLHPVVIVADTLMPNGFLYAKIRVQAYAYQRQWGDRIMQYHEGAESILYDFSRSPGDTIAVRNIGYDTADVVLTETGTITAFEAPR